MLLTNQIAANLKKYLLWCKPTMISVGVHLDVPQYMAQPWFITNVKALTVSEIEYKATSKALVVNLLANLTDRKRVRSCQMINCHF